MNAVDELQQLVYKKLISIKEPLPYSEEGIDMITQAVSDFVNNNELVEVTILVELPWYKKLVNLFYPLYPVEITVLQWRKNEN